MGSRRSKRNRKLNFLKFLRTYAIFLFILMLIFLGYVIHSLKTYENLQIDNYLNNTVKKDIFKYFDVKDLNVGKFESKDVNKKDAINKLLENSEVTYKLDSESMDLNNPVYDILVNNESVFKITLHGEKKITKLAILTIQDWKVEKVELMKKDSLYECNIEVPSNYNVYVNDVKATEDEKTKGELDEGLQQLAMYAEIPYMINYTIPGLLKEPKVKIQDENGKDVEFKKDGNTYKVELEFEEIEDEKTALTKINGSIDVLKFAKDWSLYLSNDLEGRTNGFYTINKYLIKDSYMWNYAYKWATNVDITFISSHVLDNPAFTNTKVSNFKIYNKNAFSCDVYLEKNMILKGNSKLTDKMSERMYFAYYNGEWKLVNMQSTKK